MATTHSLNTTSFWIINQNAYISLMAKLKKVFAWLTSNFSGSLMFFWMPAWAIQDFLHTDEPNSWDYGVAIFLCFAFIFFLVADIVGYRKKIRKLEKD